MTEFSENKVVGLRDDIERKFREFLMESAKPKVKAQARRARKISGEIEKMLKEYRKISIK